MGEAAAAAAAEAALRTRGRLLPDRTPGRDVRGPPRPLCPRAALGSRGRPCAPGPAGQQARGGGGNRARTRRAGRRRRRRRRPRSSSLGATWKDGGGGALGLVWGCRPGLQSSGDFMQWLQATVLLQCLKEAAVMFSLKKR